jgi:hypothetical protein
MNAFVMQFPSKRQNVFSVFTLQSQAERGIFIALPHLRAALANPDANRQTASHTPECDFTKCNCINIPFCRLCCCMGVRGFISIHLPASVYINAGVHALETRRQWLVPMTCALSGRLYIYMQPHNAKCHALVYVCTLLDFCRAAVASRE